MDAKQYVETLATAARAAAGKLAVTTGQQRNAALAACAEAIRREKAALQDANATDLARSEEFGLSEAMVDRLTLSDARIEGMAAALEQIAAQTDPVGQTISGYNRPNGLRIEKRRVPIGVIGIIFESRPNVTADAAGLCLKSANACILRGGKEAIHSNLAIAAVLREGLDAAGLPAEAVTVIDKTDREIVPAMAKAQGLIDLIIPRGGEGLIRAVVESATIPVIKHYTGNCHVYVHRRADLAMARQIVLNAKCQRPGVCNAMETLLVDVSVAEQFLSTMAAALAEAGVELRGCPATRAILPDIKEAVEADWPAEYLELILAVKVVDDIDAAMAHIVKYGSQHTEVIVTGDYGHAQRFIREVDASSVMVNASTRFADGGQFGLGAEIGISTTKLHAYGPMGLKELTTQKFIVYGDGQVRS